MAQNVSDFSVVFPLSLELFERQRQTREILHQFNINPPQDEAAAQRLLQQLFGSSHGVHIVPPFHCDLGENIHFAQGGFLNRNVTILDLAPVHFGDYVQIGPNVVISTASHPLDLAQRVLPLATANPIVIGDNVWIGAGAIILDGVTIGDRCVIGAGSVVNRDIPSDSLVVGNPARVVRTIQHSQMPTEQELEAMWAPLMAPAAE